MKLLVYYTGLKKTGKKGKLIKCFMTDLQCPQIVACALIVL